MALLKVVSGTFSALMHHNMHNYREIRKVNSALGCPSWSVRALLSVDVHVRSLSHCIPPELSMKVFNILMLLPGNKIRYTL